MLFETNNPRKFDVGFPNFETPVEIGSFSLDINREFENSQRRLRYFVKPQDSKKVEFDLRKGYETMIKNEKGKKYNILRWIAENPKILPLKRGDPTTERFQGDSQSDETLAGIQEGIGGLNISKESESTATAPVARSNTGNPRKLNVDFVCRRGLLAKLMCTPYERNDDWHIAVILHNGTYYLNEIETEKQKADEANKDDEMCCWGTKFEEYLTSDSPGGVSNPEAQYNNCEAFHTVVSAQLNSHSLVFSGVVDALNTDTETDNYYMEFKTTKLIQHRGHETTFKRFKLKKWWAQSYIIGIKEIACGFRDDSGIVRKVEYYKTEKLPDMAKDIRDPWKPNVCFNFLDQFLSFIKSSVKIDDHKIVHTLQWSPGIHGVRCGQPMRNSEYNFLPEWYTGDV